MPPANFAPEESISRAAALLADDLVRRVLPYWSATHDRRFGGFRLADTETAWPRLAERARWRLRRAVGRSWGATQPSPGEKHLVGQTRVIVALAMGHRLGFDPSGLGLATALAGASFLRDRLWDGVHGGFAWCADRRGRVISPEKLLYGQAFAMLALAELGRAAGRRDFLDAALELFRLVQDHFHDRSNSGWHEHASADFRPVLTDESVCPGTIDRAGYKSVNAHLHVLEALSELLVATNDDGVRAALEEAIAACAHFFPPDPAAACALAATDWTPIAQAGRPRVGHLLEHTWLLVRAHEALGTPVPVAALTAAVDYALLDFDRKHGGFVSGETGAGGTGRGEKEWWVQAEGLVALTTAVRLAGRRPHLEALARLADWILAYQRGRDGVWIAATDPAGHVTNPTRAGSWKAGYHEVRGAALFVRAFGATPASGGTGAFLRQRDSMNG